MSKFCNHDLYTPQVDVFFDPLYRDVIFSYFCQFLHSDCVDLPVIQKSFKCFVNCIVNSSCNKNNDVL